MAKRITWKATMLSAAALAVLPGIAMSSASADTEPAPPAAGQNVPAPQAARQAPAAPPAAGQATPAPSAAGQSASNKPAPGPKAKAKNLIRLRPDAKITAAADFNFYNRRLRSASGLCLTRVGTGYDGAVVLRTCGYTSNQLWDGVAVARDAHYNYYFHLRSGGYCLQAYNNLQNDGAAVTTAPCSTDPLYQMQLWDQAGTSSSMTLKTYVSATTTNNDECLASAGSTTVQGEPMTHRNCAFSSTATQWSLS